MQVTPRLALECYGPFSLPPYKTWAILGTGPSLYRGLYLCDDKEVGIIALNDAASVVSRADAVVLGHYEDVLENAPAFNKLSAIYIPNPCDVGYRMVKVSATNLFPLDTWSVEHPYKFRFYEKEWDFERAKSRENTLYCGSNVAILALSLLYRNGVKECMIFGIDGGRDHSALIPSTHDALFRIHGNKQMFYDAAKKDTFATAERYGIRLY